nr:immunoglobulin heavy chain junction region [Mus musculus]
CVRFLTYDGHFDFW